MEGKDEAEFARLRALEVKHGRIAMLAVVGYLTTEAGVRWDAAIDYDGVMYSDMPSGFAALSALPPLGKLQVFLTVFFLEVGVMVDKTGEAEFDGDFRNGFDFGWDKQTDAWKERKRTIELNQGRAAMMGILGLVSLTIIYSMTVGPRTLF